MAEQLEADVDRYLHAASLNIAPPAVLSDPLVAGDTPVEQLLRVLGLATNAGDSADNADSAGLHAQRDAWTTEAAGTFSGEDTAAATQVITSIAGALGGAVTAVLQPLGQLPGLLTEGAQQAVAAAASLVGQRSPIEPAPAAERGSDISDGPAPEAIDITDAADIVAPPPVDPVLPALPAPVASAATHPSGLTAAPVPRVQAVTPATSPAPAMTGMPMVPPAALPATGAGSPKADTKRIAVGPVTTRKPAVARVIRTEAGAE